MTILQCILLLISVETPDCNCNSETHCYCIGDGGRSHGCLQISEAYLRDVNDYYNLDYVFPDDCYDMQEAIDIAVLYMGRWAKLERIGSRVKFEHIARIHNGGPDGFKKIEATQPYWDKVRRRVYGE